MPKENFVPKAPKEVEEIITHKGPREYTITREEQNKRKSRIISYNNKVKAKWFLLGGLFSCSIIGLLSFFEV